jgi:hypothetical protein
MAIFPARPPERPQRGKNRETWTCTTTATVTVLDVATINSAFARRGANAYLIDEVAEGVPESELPSGPLDQVAWLVWPTAGLDVALEPDAFRILSVEVEVIEDEGDRGKLRWTVSVKLRNVDELRRRAVECCPEDAESIADSFAVAWQRAVDPFVPIRAVPGIDWQPGTVDITDVPARAGRKP